MSSPPAFGTADPSFASCKASGSAGRDCRQGWWAGVTASPWGGGRSHGLGEELWAGSPTQQAWSGRANQGAVLPIKVLPVSSWGGQRELWWWLSLECVSQPPKVRPSALAGAGVYFPGKREGDTSRRVFGGVPSASPPRAGGFSPPGLCEIPPWSLPCWFGGGSACRCSGLSCALPQLVIKNEIFGRSA